jgi:hypothetical protein
LELLRPAGTQIQSKPFQGLLRRIAFQPTNEPCGLAFQLAPSPLLKNMNDMTLMSPLRSSPAPPLGGCRTVSQSTRDCFELAPNRASEFLSGSLAGESAAWLRGRKPLARVDVADRWWDKEPSADHDRFPLACKITEMKSATCQLNQT